MSFVIAFSPFMQVDVVNDAAPTPDQLDAFAFAPTSRTRRVMADHRITYRAGGTGFALYYKRSGGVAPTLEAPISTRTRFSFAMILKEPGFFDRHHPDFAGGDAQVLLDNLDPAGAPTTGGALSVGATVEAADLVATGPADYPVRLDLTGGAPAAVEARNRFDNALVASTLVLVDPGAAETVVTVAAGGGADAALRLVAPAPSTLDRIIYADDEIADAAPVGVIDLYWDQPQDAVPAGTGAVFTTVFRRRP